MSSNNTALSVRGLSKAYTIAHEQHKHSTLAEALLHKVRNRNLVARKETFWALKDISFDIKKGEVVGIIGRNGAGKSTLLKILSRITEPTSGQIDLYGRVGSLLEVGTGFHPELTGHENIFLNGAILGMSKTEIRKHFDAIVDFAGVEKFLDTPVKRYSSGMYVRLAFAVAAHLEPEILIIDEVLAVGDASFQSKCLGKMGQVASSGRTVLFVSHNMNAIESLCRQVVHLESGRVREVTDDVRSAITNYLAVQGDNTSTSEWRNPGGTLENQWFKPLRFYLGDEQGNVVTMPVRNDVPLFIYIEGDVTALDRALNVGYGLYEGTTLLFWSASTDTAEPTWPNVKRGRNILRSEIPRRLLNQGRYRIELLIALYNREWISCPGSNAPAIELEIHGGLSDSPYWMERRPGTLAPVCNWTQEEQPGAFNKTISTIKRSGDVANELLCSPRSVQQEN